jgi:hypothetical protein
MIIALTNGGHGSSTHAYPPEQQLSIVTEIQEEKQKDKWAHGVIAVGVERHKLSHIELNSLVNNPL